MRETDLQERSERGGEKKKACLFFLLLLLLIFIGPISFRASLIPFLALSLSLSKERASCPPFLHPAFFLFPGTREVFDLIFLANLRDETQGEKAEEATRIWCYGRGRLQPYCRIFLGHFSQLPTTPLASKTPPPPSLPHTCPRIANPLWKWEENVFVASSCSLPPPPSTSFPPSANCKY